MNQNFQHYLCARIRSAYALLSAVIHINEKKITFSETSQSIWPISIPKYSHGNDYIQNIGTEMKIQMKISLH